MTIVNQYVRPKSIPKGMWTAYLNTAPIWAMNQWMIAREIFHGMPVGGYNGEIMSNVVSIVMSELLESCSEVL